MSAQTDQFANYSREELINEIKRLKKHKKFGLVWEKKKENVVEEFKTTLPYLRENQERRLELAENEPTNLLIEGDNFDSLSILLSQYAGKVDVIYIDPPYNTGSQDFAYNDNYVGKEDIYYHSKWLSFIKNRLLLARSLLSGSGIIFISIDDIEYANLKVLCDEIFGVENFLANQIVISAPAGTQSSTGFATQQSYCLTYQSSDKYELNFISLDDDQIANKYHECDEGGKYYIERIWKRGVGGRKEDVPSLHFPVYYNPSNNQILIDDEIETATHRERFVKIIPYHTAGVLGRWTWSREKMIKERDLLKVVKVAGEYKLHKKVYADMDKGKRPYTIVDSKLGRTELGSIEIKDIMNSKAFQYPKYSGLIKYFLSLHSNKSSLILDFFAGSGTTGQAVLELNKEDGGHRQFILCTNNENQIAEEVTYQRLKTVITGERADGSKYSDGIPANLRYYKVEKVPRMDSNDANRQNFAKYCEDIICIGENTYDQLYADEEFALYQNDKQITAIIQDAFGLEQIFEDIKKNNPDKKPVKAYVFSYSRYDYEDELPADLGFPVEFVAFPEGILETYKQIIKDEERGDL